VGSIDRDWGNPQLNRIVLVGLYCWPLLLTGKRFKLRKELLALSPKTEIGLLAGMTFRLAQPVAEIRSWRRSLSVGKPPRETTIP